MAGKFLLGNSETMGHSEYQANKSLPEALLFTTFNANEAKLTS